MQGLLEQNLTLGRLTDRNDDSRDLKIGLLSSIFGCWHKKLSRPFTDNKGSYVVCIECGARKSFDTKSFKTLGNFYYAPIGDARP